VAVEEVEAATQEAEVSKIKADADSDLAVAIPALAAAVKKVSEINVADFYELKSVSIPSVTIVEVFKIVCFMLGLPKPKKSNDAKKLQYDPEGYFELSKLRLLSDPKKFLG
jgi:dynein heavy chain